MLVSRTGAAEVLMEAESNRARYAALKTLDREGGLRFFLAYAASSLLCDLVERKWISSLVEDLDKVEPSRTIYPDRHHSDALHFSLLSGFTRSRQHQ
jgi:hypothetical protein